MNYLDVAIIVPVFIYLIKGFSRGLVKEVTGLLAIFIGLYVAINFSVFLEPKLEAFFNTNKSYQALNPILSFTVLFVSTLIIIKLLGHFLDRITGILALNIITKILGGVFGGLKVVLILSFILFVEKPLDIIPEKTKESSVLLLPMYDVIELILPEVEKHKEKTEKIQEEIKKTKEKIKKNYKKESIPGSEPSSK